MTGLKRWRVFLAESLAVAIGRAVIFLLAMAFVTAPSSAPPLSTSYLTTAYDIASGISLRQWIDILLLPLDIAVLAVIGGLLVLCCVALPAWAWAVTRRENIEAREHVRDAREKRLFAIDAINTTAFSLFFIWFILWLARGKIGVLVGGIWPWVNDAVTSSRSGSMLGLAALTFVALAQIAAVVVLFRRFIQSMALKSELKRGVRHRCGCVHKERTWERCAEHRRLFSEWRGQDDPRDETAQAPS